MARGRRGRRLAIGAGLALALAAMLGAAPVTPVGPPAVRAADPMAAEGPAGGPVAVDPMTAGSGGPAPEVAPAPTSATASADQRVRVVWRGPRKDRVVALTFDDGWNAGTLRSIYRTLVREGVPATFFVTGMYIQRAPDLWREIAVRFPIANHSNRHRDTRSLSDAEVIADLVRTRATVERATGRPMLPYFRPPYGYHNARTDRLAAAAGFPTIVMWDATATDTAPRPTVRSVVRSAAAGRPGSIVLLHAGPVVTARALPAIIARYRERGFRFVTLPELIGLRRPAERRPEVRALDRPDEPLVAHSSGSGAATAGADPAPVPATAAPAAPAPTAVPTPARDMAWARSDGTPGALAVGTAASLLVMLLAAAAFGRRRPAEGDPAPRRDGRQGDPAP